MKFDRMCKLMMFAILMSFICMFASTLAGSMGWLLFNGGLLIVNMFNLLDRFIKINNWED